MAKNSRTDEYLSLNPASNGYVFWSDLVKIDSRIHEINSVAYPHFFAGRNLLQNMEIDNKLTLVCLLACLNQEDYDMAMNTL